MGSYRDGICPRHHGGRDEGAVQGWRCHSSDISVSLGDLMHVSTHFVTIPCFPTIAAGNALTTFSAVKPCILWRRPSTRRPSTRKPSAGAPLAGARLTVPSNRQSRLKPWKCPEEIEITEDI